MRDDRLAIIMDYGMAAMFLEPGQPSSTSKVCKSQLQIQKLKDWLDHNNEIFHLVFQLRVVIATGN